MKWSSNFAYAVGLFTADGCLSSDNRHLEFNSKDKEQVLNFVRCLDLRDKIGKKARGGEKLKDIIEYSLEIKNFIIFFV